MLELLVFLVAVVLISVVAVCVRTVYIAGWSGMLEYYRTTPVYKDWLMFIRYFIPIAILLGLLVLSFSAQASDLRMFQYTELFYGLDFQKDAPECLQSSIEDNTTVNGGIRQHLIGKSFELFDADLAGSYTHHSCAIGQDDKVYDAVGLMLTIRFSYN